MTMNHHGHMALMMWAASWVLAIAGGIAFSMSEHIKIIYGVYWALTTVTTVGYGDITPHNLSGYIVADLTMVLTIPIWSVAIAFATSWFTSWHIWESHEKLATHVTNETSTPGTAWVDAASNPPPDTFPGRGIS